ncbi:MAG: hypothetical protein AAFX10_02325 [Pseudomonadota bacterium]
MSIGACTAHAPLTPADPAAAPPPDPVAEDTAGEQSGPPSRAGVPHTAERPEPRIDVVVSGTSAVYEGLVEELETRLGNGRVFYLTADEPAQAKIFENVNELGAEVVVTVGMRAARAAATYADMPSVFCQVFNETAAELAGDDIRGVSSIPPLDQQLAIWRELDPQLGSVGAILGDGSDRLLAEARSAARRGGLGFHGRRSHSDRETLYHFERMLDAVDGFWLFPDNRILSPPVLEAIFSYAQQAGVQVAVFNPSLIAMGADLGFTANDADVAATALRVAADIARGDGAGIPRITALSTVDVIVSRTDRHRLRISSARTEHPDVTLLVR